MKRNFFLFGNKKNSRQPAQSIDDFVKRMAEQESQSQIDNKEFISGGVLEGRSPEFIDLTPSHTHRNFNNEFDMLP